MGERRRWVRLLASHTLPSWSFGAKADRSWVQVMSRGTRLWISRARRVSGAPTFAVGLPRLLRWLRWMARSFRRT
jgi:hypothetical protein